jgi:hypothetical protein
LLGSLARVLGAVISELGLHFSHPLLVGLHAGLELVLLRLQNLVFLSFALARVVGGETVALYAFYPSLLLFILGLGSLPRGQAGLWLGKHLAPRLALLHRLGAIAFWRWCM